MDRIGDWLMDQRPQGRVIDAYCGIGTITFHWPGGLQVFGIEINPDSIDQARGNAARNELDDCTAFVAGDVAALLRANSRTVGPWFLTLHEGA